MCNISLAIESVSVNPIVGIEQRKSLFKLKKNSHLLGKQLRANGQFMCGRCKRIKSAGCQVKGKAICLDCSRERMKEHKARNPEFKRIQAKRRSEIYHSDVEESRRKGRKYYRKSRHKKGTAAWLLREMKDKLGLGFCRHCMEVTPLEEMVTSKKCRPCENARARVNNKKMRDRNPDLVRSWKKKYCDDNIEKIRARDRKYRSENREKRRAGENRRRAREANAPGKATADQIQARFDYHGNKCIYCGCSGQPLDIEHMIPLARGGSNWPSNLAPACKSCNCRKGTKTHAEFVATIHETASV